MLCCCTGSKAELISRLLEVHANAARQGVPPEDLLGGPEETDPEQPSENPDTSSPAKSEAPLEKWTLVELRAALKQRGKIMTGKPYQLPISWCPFGNILTTASVRALFCAGNKPDLINRLRQALDGGDEGGEDGPRSGQAASGRRQPGSQVEAPWEAESRDLEYSVSPRPLDCLV